MGCRGGEGADLRFPQAHLVPFGHTICHNRNRTYSPQLGRFNQLDPNATAMALLEASVYHGKGVGALALAFSVEEMYGDGLNLYEYLGSNPWNRSDPMGLSWDPFDMVDEYLAEDAGSKAAFVQSLGMGARATAILAATIASYLPIPGLSFVGDMALYALGEAGAGETAVALGLGIIPGGKLAQLFARSGVGKFLGRMTASAWSAATHYARQVGAGLLNGARNAAGTILAAARGLIKKGCGCFEAGTLVWTERGLVPIEQVGLGDYVWAQDEQTGGIELREVTETFTREGAPIVEVTVLFGDGHAERLRTTEEHPFWVPGKGWVPAQNLRSGLALLTTGGVEVQVLSLRLTSERATVYNFEVEGLHNYFVGPNGVLAHNGRVCPWPKPRYEINPAHQQHGRRKTPIPDDAPSAYEGAIWHDGHFWGLSSKGDVYRYSHNNGSGAQSASHFSGSASSGVRVPNEVQKFFGVRIK